MNQFLLWMSLKRDLLEVWILNATVATLSFADLPVILVSISALLTAGYTAHKWYNEVQDRKNKNV